MPAPYNKKLKDSRIQILRGLWIHFVTVTPSLWFACDMRLYINCFVWLTLCAVKQAKRNDDKYQFVTEFANHSGGQHVTCGLIGKQVRDNTTGKVAHIQLTWMKKFSVTANKTNTIYWQLQQGYISDCSCYRKFMAKTSSKKLLKLTNHHNKYK